MYRLKRNEAPFEVVDGPAAGRRFAHGVDYPEVPAGEGHRFEHTGEVIIARMAQAEEPARKGKKSTETKEVTTDAE
ncbi:MAG: hypothetical protein RBR18_14665 [Desulfovibrionaceae bacterium]|jgi:hypothetical protein|nr:hypothetical protein [Desulfovibrionaceae bacterium]